jgi:diketogulonate reductase-like aldo/keto reductase
MKEQFTLNNGVKMPEVGLGTFRMPSNAAQKAVEAALADGYHLIDTAEAYYTMKMVLVLELRILVSIVKIYS